MILCNWIKSLSEHNNRVIWQRYYLSYRFFYTIPFYVTESRGYYTVSIIKYYDILTLPLFLSVVTFYCSRFLQTLTFVYNILILTGNGSNNLFYGSINIMVFNLLFSCYKNLVIKINVKHRPLLNLLTYVLKLYIKLFLFHQY